MTDDRLPTGGKIAGRDQRPGNPHVSCPVHQRASETSLRKVETKVIENGKQTTSSPDPGLATLVMLLRFQGIGVDPSQISHQRASKNDAFSM